MTDEAHDSPQRYIAITRARLIARYRMHSIPGRPEELEHNLAVTGDVRRVISIAYAGGEMRIRKHGGHNNRKWVDVRDFRLRDGWLDEVYEYLDMFFGVGTEPGLRLPDPIRITGTLAEPVLVKPTPATAFGYSRVGQVPRGITTDGHTRVNPPVV
jgi:hypothetical protein